MSSVWVITCMSKALRTTDAQKLLCYDDISAGRHDDHNVGFTNLESGCICCN